MIPLLEDSDIPDWRAVLVSCDVTRKGTTGYFRTMVPDEPIQKIPALSLLDAVLVRDYHTSLKGAHQAYNMGCAISLAALLLPYSKCMKKVMEDGSSYPSAALEEDPLSFLNDIGTEDLVKGISEGIGSVRIVDRFEISDRSGSNLILDGGHNNEAALSIRRTFGDIYGDRKAHLLVAMMKDKDPFGFIGPLSDLCESLTVTVADKERGMEPVRIALAAALTGGCYPIHIREDPEKAVEEFLTRAEDGIGIACGTFHLYKYLVRKPRSPHVRCPPDPSGDEDPGLREHPLEAGLLDRP